MNTLPAGNPKPPEHINNQNEHPLKDFLILAGAAIALVTLIGVLLAYGASFIAPHIPYEWEVKYLQSSTELEPETDSALDRQKALKVEGYLTKLINDLVGKDVLPIKVHFLPEEDMPNAFATLGGHIFVTQGLLDHIESENGLAMVLAHEYAHIELRHPAILMLEQLSFSLLFKLVGNNAASVFTEQSAMFTALAFSRDMEREADASALKRLQNHYGHTYGAEEFFINIKKLQHEQESDHQDSHSEDTLSRWKAFLQTHPATDERIEKIKARRINPKGKLTPLIFPINNAVE